jgi:hypothetical protein
MEVRKFLKRFGVSAQREIEKAAQQAGAGAEAGQVLRVRARLEIEGVGEVMVIEDELRLA